MAEHKNLYIGLMSGTSLDGVDAVLVSFDQEFPVLVSSHSHLIPPELKNNLLGIIKPDWTGSLKYIGTLNAQLGYLFADSVNALLNKSNVSAKNITAVGSHGQTTWHQPTGKFPFSMQLGDASLIVELTGITTVADFRSRDIAAGGQGAPLVPAFHHHTLRHSHKNRVILNIGGIANISYLPSKNSDDNVSGFDTGPGNGLMDAWVSKHKNKPYDKNGEWANTGQVDLKALELLSNDPYFALAEPKSTGKEAFNLEWLKQQLNNKLTSYKPKDIQATLLELTVQTIAEQIPQNCDEIFVCGGGVQNKKLIERLQERLSGIPVKSSQLVGIDPDWMEAIAFAWLAKQTIESKAGNLPITTGASGLRTLGAIHRV